MITKVLKIEDFDRFPFRTIFPLSGLASLVLAWCHYEDVIVPWVHPISTEYFKCGGGLFPRGR